MIILKDITSKDSLIEYFKFKEKHDYSFSPDELNKFLINLSSYILNINGYKKFNTVFIPETDNLNLIKLSSLVSEKTIIIKKNRKDYIISKLNEQSYQKKEKESLFQSLENMQTIKMANIKGNQRKRFIDILFEKVDSDISMDNSLLLDDSYFSGLTYKALKRKIPNTTKNVVLFSKDAGELYE